MVGGGLDEYKRCERELYDFGRLEDCGMDVPLSAVDIPSKQIDSQVGESESKVDKECEALQSHDALIDSIECNMDEESDEELALPRNNVCLDIILTPLL